MKLREIITEAKYHGSNITVEQVNDMYYDAYEADRTGLSDHFTISKPRLYEYGTIMSIHTHTRVVQTAVDIVKRYLKEKNLPYTEFEIDEYKGVTVIVKYIKR